MTHKLAAPARIAVLVSGRGSHLRAIAAAIAARRLHAELVLVASDRPDCAAIHWAREQGLTVVCDDSRRRADRQHWDRWLFDSVAQTIPDWIVLAGFMRILSPSVLTAWSQRMINIHPSLLPRYPGIKTHARVLEAGDKQHGASVHFVTAELDAGPVLMQTRIAVGAGDTEASLAQRLLAHEHALMEASLQLLLSGRAQIQHGRVTVDGDEICEPLIHESPEFPATCSVPSR